MARSKQKVSALRVLFPLVVLLFGALVYNFRENIPLFVPNGEADVGKPLPPGEYMFCFWNLENFFDNIDDSRNNIDDPYDDWFASDAEAYQLKLQRHCEVLLKLNGGRGPDILALAEVESEAAANALKDALNERLPEGVEPYKDALFKKVARGRHISCPIITRLNVVRNKTQQFDRSRRIVKGHVNAGGKELIVIASHWTSRISDKDGSGRGKYAKLIYGRVREMYQANKDVDVIVCGDFNDGPEDRSVVEHLHATGNKAAVLNSTKPLLLNLMANKNPLTYGTHYYDRDRKNGPWFIFDQVVVSPGMLDQNGWTCKVDSVRTIRPFTDSRGKSRGPWGFETKNKDLDPEDRGYSDHYPVVVTLSVK
ncbi:MAG: endonuclease/exonuclease/phosphatase family protein [Gemmataceae bacterium]